MKTPLLIFLFILYFFSSAFSSSSTSAFSFSSSSSPDSSLTAQMQLVNSLYEQEKYFDAITEAKRLIFFDTQNTFSFEANTLIAESYKKGGKLSDALRYFANASKFAFTPEEKYNNKISAIRIHILNRSIAIAIRQINEMSNQPAFSDKKTDLAYWRGWAYMFADRWEEAAGEFNSIDSSHYLKNFCLDIDNKEYSVTFARTISYFLPGAGQVYTGEYLNGILSLGWNLLSGYLTITAFREERVFDGAALLSLLWMRFYTGNISNAEKFAKEKNLEISNSALNYLQLNYKGLKP